MNNLSLALLILLLPLFRLSAQDKNGDMAEIALPQIRTELEADVRFLNDTIGERHPHVYEKLAQTVQYLEKRLPSAGFKLARHTYELSGKQYVNLVFAKDGSVPAAPHIVLGAHYDTVANTPGADDNASGVAVLLALSRLLAGYASKHPLQIVFFALEEPPYFRTADMGSTRYAHSMKEAGAAIKLMVALDMVGYYSGEQKQLNLSGQSIAADFIAVVSKPKDQQVAQNLFHALKRNSALPVELVIAPPDIRGIDFSDHLSFWKYGYPALMLTDTAFHRNDRYHTPLDTADTLDYHCMALLAQALAAAVKEIDQEK